ncbi:hypothetical protein A2U01_0098138, partial [Trifolium medium]|nr:hypothetical protein [Trifolium medium]
MGAVLPPLFPSP